MKNINLITLLLVLISSCKNQDDMLTDLPVDPIAPTSNEFYPMSVGSYWAYEFSSHSPSGSITPSNIKDTLRIIGDTLIDGDKYFTFHYNVPFPDKIYYSKRNEMGEIVTQNNKLICPPDNNYPGVFNEHYGFLNQDTSYYYWEEFSGYEEVNTSFGDSYTCLQMTAFHESKLDFNYGQVVADTNYYSPIGILQRSYSYSSGSKLVGTLVDYHFE